MQPIAGDRPREHEGPRPSTPRPRRDDERSLGAMKARAATKARHIDAHTLTAGSCPSRPASAALCRRAVCVAGVSVFFNVHAPRRHSAPSPLLQAAAAATPMASSVLLSAATPSQDALDADAALARRRLVGAVAGGSTSTALELRLRAALEHYAKERGIFGTVAREALKDQ